MSDSSFRASLPISLSPSSPTSLSTSLPSFTSSSKHERPILPENAPPCVVCRKCGAQGQHWTAHCVQQQCTEKRCSSLDNTGCSLRFVPPSLGQVRKDIEREDVGRFRQFLEEEWRCQERMMMITSGRCKITIPDADEWKTRYKHLDIQVVLLSFFSPLLHLVSVSIRNSAKSADTCSATEFGGNAKSATITTFAERARWRWSTKEIAAANIRFQRFSIHARLPRFFAPKQ